MKLQIRLKMMRIFSRHFFVFERLSVTHVQVFNVVSKLDDDDHDDIHVPCSMFDVPCSMFGENKLHKETYLTKT